MTKKKLMACLEVYESALISVAEQHLSLSKIHHRYPNRLLLIVENYIYT